jgi:hypothetical protein
LVITEVFIDGSDEYIEIYNQWEDYQWTIYIDGIKSSRYILDVFIPWNTTYLIADQWNMIIDTTIHKIWAWIQLTDTTWHNIILYHQNEQELDRFELSQSMVVSIDNTKTSFQKSRDGTTWNISAPNEYQRIHTINWYSINPWFVVWIHNNTNILTWLQQQAVDTWSNILNATWNNNEPEAATWSTITWDNQDTNNSLNQNTNDESTTSNNSSNQLNSWPANITIDEIQPLNTQDFWEYIELLFHDTYQWWLRIVWGWHWSAEIHFDVHQWAWSRLVISKNMLSVPSHVHESLSLTDGWQDLQIIDKNWYVLQSIRYNASIPWKSLYIWTNTEWWNQLFNNQEIMTPWFWFEHIQHFYKIWTTQTYSQPCWIIFQNRIPWYAGTSINLAATRDWEIIQNNDSAKSCIRTIWQEIISNDCNPSFITMSWAVLDTLVLSVDDSNNICTHAIPLNIPSKISWSTNDWKNYYEEYRLWKDKFSELHKAIRLLWFDLSAPKLLSIDDRIVYQNTIDLVSDVQQFSWSIIIDAVLPNPSWKDTNEWLRLSVYGTWIIENIIFSHGKYTHLLWPIDLEQGTIEFFTGFMMPNKGWCVSLLYWETTLDTLCYPTTTDKVWYNQYGPIDWSWIYLTKNEIPNILRINQTSKQICIMFNNDKQYCEDILRSKTQEKTLLSSLRKFESESNKQTKYITSLEKKYKTLVDKYDDSKSKEKEIKNAMKELRSKYADRRKNYNNTLKNVRTANKNLTEINMLHKQYIDHFSQLMYNKEYTLTSYQYSNFVNQHILYSNLVANFRWKNDKILLYPYAQWNAYKILALSQWKLNDEDLTYIYPLLYKNLLSKLQIIPWDVSSN